MRSNGKEIAASTLRADRVASALIRRGDAQAALDTFSDRVTLARIALKEIEQALDDHLGVAPEAVHWGHAGDAGRLLGRVNCNHRSAVPPR